MNAVDGGNHTVLYVAGTLEVFNALVECGADPTLPDFDGCAPLIVHLTNHRYHIVTQLLQDPRVQASVNAPSPGGSTALHYVCMILDIPKLPAIIQLLLLAGADLTLKNSCGELPIDVLQRTFPTHPTTLALVEQSLDAEKTSFLVKARRFVMAAARTTPLSYLQSRAGRGQPLPLVALAPVTGDQNDDELRTILAFLVGMEGGGMPRDVFRVVLDLLVPPWDPLRRKAQGGGAARV